MDLMLTQGNSCPFPVLTYLLTLNKPMYVTYFLLEGKINGTHILCTIKLIAEELKY